MLDARELQRVPPSRDHADRLVEQARTHLASADAVCATDPADLRGRGEPLAEYPAARPGEGRAAAVEIYLRSREPRYSWLALTFARSEAWSVPFTEEVVWANVRTAWAAAPA